MRKVKVNNLKFNCKAQVDEVNSSFVDGWSPFEKSV